MPPVTQDIADETGNQSGATVALSLLLFAMVTGGLYYFYDHSKTKALYQENQRLVVTQVLQFPAVVRTGVARLQASGVALEKIDFSPESKGPKAVFHSNGGGVRYQTPPDGLLSDQGRWRFKTVNAAGEGWFIAGLGSDEEKGKDVFAYLQGLPQDFCEMVNRTLGLPAAPKVESVAIDLATPGPVNGTAGLNAWTFAAHSRPALAGGENATPSAACVQNGNGGSYVFYHLLAAQ